MKLRNAALVAAISALATGVSQAQTASISYQRLNVGQGLSWTLDGNATSSYAGSFIMLIDAAGGPMAPLVGSEINVFCLDPLQSVGNGSVNYTQTTPAGLQMFATNGAAKEAAVMRLLGYSNNLHNTTLSANYATAFQISLWEIARDYDGTFGSLNAFTGGFQYDEASLGGNAAAVKAEVLAMLAAAGNTSGAVTTDTVYALRSNYHQDLIHTRPANAVPEPSTLALLGVGAVGLVARRRRK